MLFFDERFNFVAEGSTQIRVATAGDNAAPLAFTNLKVPKSRKPSGGYCYIYISNESSVDVFFDNLQVRHDRGRILEENHYYAFGLKIAALSSKAYAAPANNYQYQGDYSEFDDDLGWNDFQLRSYDPQIGRFLQHDPFDQFASGYVGMGNDPGNGVDPSGGINIPANLCQLAAYAVADLNSVTVIGSLAKVGARARAVFKGIAIANAIQDIGRVISDQLWNISAATTAVLDNASGGLLNFRQTFAPDPNNNPQAARSFNNGLVAGDIASMMIATIEGTMGEGMLGAGGIATLTGVGAPGGIPTAVTGGVAIAHSLGFFARAVYNFINKSGQVNIDVASEPANQPKFEEATPEDTGNQNLQDFKKVNGNKEGNKAAREAGYEDAHDLKETTLGTDQGLSKFNIYKDKKTGDLELRTLDEKVRIPVTKRN